MTLPVLDREDRFAGVLGARRGSDAERFDARRDALPTVEDICRLFLRGKEASSGGLRCVHVEDETTFGGVHFLVDGAELWAQRIAYAPDLVQVDASASAAATLDALSAGARAVTLTGHRERAMSFAGKLAARARQRDWLVLAGIPRDQLLAEVAQRLTAVEAAALSKPGRQPAPSTRRELTGKGLISQRGNLTADGAFVRALLSQGAVTARPRRRLSAAQSEALTRIAFSLTGGLHAGTRDALLRHGLVEKVDGELKLTDEGRSEMRALRQES